MSQAMLTVDELAYTLKVPKSWIYSRTREKSADPIPHTRVGKYRRFNLDLVLNWLKERSKQGGAA